MSPTSYLLPSFAIILLSLLYGITFFFVYHTTDKKNEQWIYVHVHQEIIFIYSISITPREIQIFPFLLFLCVKELQRKKIFLFPLYCRLLIASQFWLQLQPFKNSKEYIWCYSFINIFTQASLFLLYYSLLLMFWFEYYYTVLLQYTNQIISPGIWFFFFLFLFYS